MSNIKIGKPKFIPSTTDIHCQVEIPTVNMGCPDHSWEAGPTGPMGPRGYQGLHGHLGPQGAQGEPGRGLNIVGVEEDILHLPSCDCTPMGTAYMVGQKIYVFVGEDNGEDYTPQHAWRKLVSGVRGYQGAQGPQGDVGPMGPMGPVGPTGPQGTAGKDGLVGPMGSRGYQGAQGIAGKDGQVGPMGPQGPVGPTGPQGSAGTSFQIVGSVPSLDQLPSDVALGTAYLVGTDCYVFVGNGVGDPNTPNQAWSSISVASIGPTGPMGPVGPTGPQGAKGEGVDSIRTEVELMKQQITANSESIIKLQGVTEQLEQSVQEVNKVVQEVVAGNIDGGEIEL